MSETRHSAAGGPGPARVPNGSPPPAGDEGWLEVLSERLRASPGVVSVEADFREATLHVRYQPALVEPDRLDALADEVAALFARHATCYERHGTEDACVECGLRLGSLSADDRERYRVTHAQDRMGLSRRDVPADSAHMVRPFAGAKPWGATLSPAVQEHLAKGRLAASLTAVSLAGLIAGQVAERVGLPLAAQQAAYLVSALAGGWFAVRSSVAALARLRFDVNLLMLLAAAGAAAIGYALEAAVLMFLFALSNTLEIYTMGRTRRALHALLRLHPQSARVRREGRETEVPVEEVRPGEIAIVTPGRTIPVDGVVAAGSSLVDQSSLTGESVPVPKGPGDQVFAGTLNQQGALEVRVTRAAGDTTLARVVRLVEEAQEQKARTEELAEWVGRHYTIAVILGALLMLLVPLLGRGDLHSALYRAMTLLVVASPCALVIATPATILSAIAAAARNGVLFKGGRYIEALGRVKAVAFDKTGTLTGGRFEVTDVVALDGAREDDVLGWAAGAELRSQHPLALAVVRAARARGLAVAPATHLTSHLGKGLIARLDGAEVEVGTPGLFAQLGAAVPPAGLEHLRRFSREAKTAMLVRRGAAWGVIAAADGVRPAAAGTVAELRRLGVRSVALLSGDAPPTVEAIAGRTGVDAHHGALLPEDKVRLVGELEARHGAVAMVGDGVNDAPALARATVGIAMGGMGADAALESADVVLMGDDLAALPYAVRLARHARRVVLQNVLVAAGVMLALVTLVFVGSRLPFALPPWMVSAEGNLRLPFAVSGHEGSTVVVILNGLRLLAERRGKAG